MGTLNSSSVTADTTGRSLIPTGAGHRPTEDDTFLSEDQTELASDVLIKLRYVVISFALPLTLINVIVFWQKDMRSATSVYVIGTSFAQLYYVIMLAAHNVLLSTLSDPMNDMMFWVFTLYAASYGVASASRGIYLVMCLVSVERLYAIARPLHAKSFFLSRRPVLCTVSAFALSFVLNVYVIAKTEIREKREVGTGRTVYKPAPTSLYLKHKDVNLAFSLAAKILLYYSTLSLQMVLNVLTICCLRRHNASQKNVTSSAADDAKMRRERQMTVTILFATISYVILNLPTAVHHLVYNFIPEKYGIYGMYKNLYVVLGYLFVDMELLSCGIDFVWFVTLSSSYRRAFCRIFRIASKKTANNDTSLDTVTKMEKE